MILNRIKQKTGLVFKACLALVCCFSFTIAHLNAQTQRKILLDFVSENIPSKVLYPLILENHPKKPYKNIPSGIVKSVLAYFDIDRIQSTYERYMVNDNDSAAWNKYAKERNIKNNQVYHGNLKNSIVGVFMGIDSAGNKIVVWDSNDNADFADDKIYSVPKESASDTTFSVDLPFQYFDGISKIDTILNLGFFPALLFRSSNNPIDPELGIEVFSKANFIGDISGKEMDYKLIFVPKLIRRDSVHSFRIHTLNKNGIELRSSSQTLNDNLFLDGSNWKIVSFTPKEIILEQIETALSGYRTGQLFQGTPLITDYVSKEIIKNVPKNKYLLIDFWGTWCKPCIAQIPELVNFWKKHKDDIVLISVLHDEQSNMDIAKKIIADYGMDWIHVWDDTKDSKWAKPMGINVYPGFIFVDKGNIVLSSDEGVDIFKLVEETITEGKR